MSEYIYASYGEPLIDNSYDILLAREEIVRCKDCKYFFCLWYDAAVCKRNEDKFMPWIDPSGFCAWGVRREL